MSSVTYPRSNVALVAAISLFAAGASGAAASPDAISATNTRAPIKHVIVIVMENRSFDNLFHGYPGADTVNFGYGHTGNQIQLEPTPFEGNCDPDHSHEAWVSDYNGGAMNGFDTTPPSCIGKRRRQSARSRRNRGPIPVWLSAVCRSETVLGARQAVRHGATDVRVANGPELSGPHVHRGGNVG
jgi:hypothetical protein